MNHTIQTEEEGMLAHAAHTLCHDAVVELVRRYLATLPTKAAQIYVLNKMEDEFRFYHAGGGGGKGWPPLHPDPPPDLYGDPAYQGEIQHRLSHPVPIMTTYAIKTANGYLAVQGNQHWFQEEPTGWALFSTKRDARNVAALHHSAFGTAPDEGYEIESLP